MSTVKNDGYEQQYRKTLAGWTHFLAKEADGGSDRWESHLAERLETAADPNDVHVDGVLELTIKLGKPNEEFKPRDTLVAARISGLDESLRKQIAGRSLAELEVPLMIRAEGVSEASAGEQFIIIRGVAEPRLSREEQLKERQGKSQRKPTDLSQVEYQILSGNSDSFERFRPSDWLFERGSFEVFKKTPQEMLGDREYTGDQEAVRRMRAAALTATSLPSACSSYRGSRMLRNLRASTSMQRVSVLVAVAAIGCSKSPSRSSPEEAFEATIAALEGAPAERRWSLSDDLSRQIVDLPADTETETWSRRLLKVLDETPRDEDYEEFARRDLILALGQLGDQVASAPCRSSCTTK